MSHRADLHRLESHAVPVAAGARLIVCLLFVLAACGGCGDDGRDAAGVGGTTQETVAVTVDTRPGEGCGHARARPVSVQQLVRTFAKRGIALYREEECAERSEVYLASNLAAPLSAEELEALSARQGDILCALYGSRYGTQVRRTHYEGEEETDLDVLNVNCTVYPSDADRAEQQIASVEAAMRDLMRETK